MRSTITLVVVNVRNSECDLLDRNDYKRNNITQWEEKLTTVTETVSLS